MAYLKFKTLLELWIEDRSATSWVNQTNLRILKCFCLFYPTSNISEAGHWDLLGAHCISQGSHSRKYPRILCPCGGNWTVLPEIEGVFVIKVALGIENSKDVSGTCEPIIRSKMLLSSITDICSLTALGLCFRVRPSLSEAIGQRLRSRQIYIFIQWVCRACVSEKDGLPLDWG